MGIMPDYQWMKGFNYVPSYARNDIEFWRDYDSVMVERELEYAKRLGLNCARVFLAYVVYRQQKEKFLDAVLHFVRTAHSLGIKTMPVVWDSCFSEKEPVIDVDSNEWYANPGVMYLGEAFWAEEEIYCQDLIRLLSQEPGLIMWDIHNEPLMTSYIYDYEEEERRRHTKVLWCFTEHFCRYFREQDPDNPVTVGVDNVDQLDRIGCLCDVLSFHDYSPTWQGIEAAFAKGLDFARRLNKPLLCSEMCCAARANPYDVAIEIAMRSGVGYILWELMIGKCFWYDRHGICYPDGTVRDPAIVAAIMGFFRRRENCVAYNVNTELYGDRCLQRMRLWRENGQGCRAEGLEILCMMANLLEAGQLVAQCNLPSTRYLALAHDEAAGREALIGQMDEWALILQADIEAKRHANYRHLVH